MPVCYASSLIPVTHSSQAFYHTFMEMRKLGTLEVKLLSQGHRAPKEQRQEVNADSLLRVLSCLLKVPP